MIIHRWEAKPEERERVRQFLGANNGRANLIVHPWYTEDAKLPGYTKYRKNLEEYISKTRRPTFILAEHGSVKEVAERVRRLKPRALIVIIPTLDDNATPAHKGLKERSAFGAFSKKALEVQQATGNITMVPIVEAGYDTQWEQLTRELEGYGVRDLKVGGEICEYDSFGDLIDLCAKAALASKENKDFGRDAATDVDSAVSLLLHYSENYVKDVHGPEFHKYLLRTFKQVANSHGGDKALALRMLRSRILPKSGCVRTAVKYITKHSDSITPNPVKKLVWRVFSDE